MDKTIQGLKFIKAKLYNGIFKDKLSCIDEAIEFINKNDWIPCTVVEHPNHCNPCEVTMKGKNGLEREIGFFADKWRREGDEAVIDVVAWKEPSAPYNNQTN